jgi:hypothetical protein
VWGKRMLYKMAQTQAVERASKILVEDLPLKQAVVSAVKLTGEKKNFVYEMALRLKGKECRA